MLAGFVRKDWALLIRPVRPVGDAQIFLEATGRADKPDPGHDRLRCCHQFPFPITPYPESSPPFGQATTTPAAHSAPCGIVEYPQHSGRRGRHNFC